MIISAGLERYLVAKPLNALPSSTSIPFALAVRCFKIGGYVSGTMKNDGMPTAAARIKTIHAVHRQPRWLSVMNDPMTGPIKISD